MLGFTALAEVALAEIPSGGVERLAWRRELAQRRPRMKTNRDAPVWLVWAKEDEAAVLLATML